jgi:hypothetical protein
MSLGYGKRSVDFHLERRLKQIGQDQIPWDWTLRFTATSCVLSDSIDIDTPKIVQRQVIRARLRPGSPRDDGDDETMFSMFGTDRTVKSFELEIHPIADPAKQESCSAWGSVSYTTEIDFSKETLDDCITFYLFVKPETFARYGAKIAHGLVDEVTLSVKSVDGFYSEWSPGVSTSKVKVLTSGSEQKIVFPPGREIKPPRLGHVGAAELYINRRLEFSKPVPAREVVGEVAGLGTETAPEAQRPGADPRMLNVLGSVRKAAWFAVCLLALIFIVTLLKH